MSLGTLVAVVALAVAAPTAGAPTHGPDPAASRPAVVQRAAGPPTALYVDPTSAAAGQEAVFGRIARTPQAAWFTDAVPTTQVAQAARDYVDRAQRVRRRGVMVVYAIPNRDCGGHSAGGLPTAAAYRGWIDRFALGIRGRRPLVVVEPDAIAFSGNPSCGNVAGRLALLRYAVRRLSAVGAWVYLDAGHSAWTPTTGRASLLRRAGVGYARGISTNVSNFRPLATEQVYARRLLKELARLGVRGKRYVVDTSRNGARRPVTGDVINPTWARLGPAPRLVLDGAFDGRLWVKRPGESDGYANGGPAAGQWCDALGLRLLGRGTDGRC